MVQDPVHDHQDKHKPKWCAIRESNPGLVLGKHQCYHYTNGALSLLLNPNGSIPFDPGFGKLDWNHFGKSQANPTHTTSEFQRSQFSHLLTCLELYEGVFS